MPMLNDRDALRYNRDEREIRQLQYGRGLTKKKIHQGQGVLDVVGQAGRWVSDNKQVIGDVVDTVGKVVKTGIQVKKELEDLERVKALRKAQEASFRKEPIESSHSKNDVFKSLRLQAEQIKKNGNKKGEGLFLS
jgi:hypothetical protein